MCLIGITTAPAAPFAEEIGKSFATERASKATEGEKLELLGQAPRIPPALDAQLIRRATEGELDTEPGWYAAPTGFTRIRSGKINVSEAKRFVVHNPRQ